MKDMSKAGKDRMGRLNNQIVDLIDKAELNPPEVLLVLKMLINRIEQLFILSLRQKGNK